MALPLGKSLKWKFYQWRYLRAKRQIREVINFAVYGVLYDSVLAITKREREKKRHVARLLRSALSFAWLTGLVNPLLAGIAFVSDSLASMLLFRNKTGYGFYTDMARIFKLTLGVLIIIGFIL